MTCDVCIATGMDRNLGAGHFQRMSALAWRLAHKFQMRVRIVSKPCEGKIPSEISQFLADYFIPAKLVVRDKRDSSGEEIENLKKYGKVCVVDDRGEGRLAADLRIDVLPHFGNMEDATKAPFLFGFNYIQNLEALEGEEVIKDNDVVMYAGFSGESGELLQSLLPDKSRYCVVGGQKAIVGVKGGVSREEDINYARMLCASKVAISHFGIFLYEADAALCHVDSVNPTEYHSDIAESAKKELPIVNFGVKDALNFEISRQAILSQIEKPRSATVVSGKVLEKVISSVDSFAETLLRFL